VPASTSSSAIDERDSKEHVSAAGVAISLLHHAIWAARAKKRVELARQTRIAHAARFSISARNLPCSRISQAAVAHYRLRELRCDNTWKTYSTRRGYDAYLKRWIVPRWGTYRLSDIKSGEVESWLRELTLARASCNKIRNVMSVPFLICSA
jgi:hypothetical protein